MAISYMKGITGVFGDPIAENPTLLMQQAAYDAANLPFVYLNFQVPADQLERAVAGARAMGFAGFNCTIPHKVNVLQYLDEIEPDAQVMGAVNTVYRDGARLIGANTDGKGFIKALEVNHVPYADANIVLLGSGGAARAVCVELAFHGVRQLTIVNRSEQRGRALCALLEAKTQCKATFVPWRGCYDLAEQTDLLINTTSIGLYPDAAQPDINYARITPNMTVCDVIPNPPRTRFLTAAAQRGAKTLDGLGMLVYQGAAAFSLWTGQPAPVQVMIDALKFV